jgi:hypothetical protein
MRKALPSHDRLLRSGCALLVLATLLRVSAATETTAREALFVEANVEFILLHELAHVLIVDLEVPIVGPEENAADYIATIVLMSGEDPRDASRAERARQLVAAAASGFAAEWTTTRPPVAELPFWDSHALNIQRFFQIACLLYGSSPSTLPSLPQRAGMPAARAAQCPREYARASRAVEWLVSVYGRGGRSAETLIHIDYGEPPPSQVSLQLLRHLREGRVLETVVERFERLFVLPEPLTIALRRCRRANALWNEESRTVTICVELLDYYYLLARSAASRGLESSLNEEVPEVPTDQARQHEQPRLPRP